MHKQLSLRLKIIASGVLVFTLTGLAMLAGAQWVLKSTGKQEAQRAAQGSRALLSSALAPLVAMQDVGGLQELADDLVRRESLAWLVIVDDQGRPLAQSGNSHSANATAHEMTIELAGQTYGRARFGLDQGAFEASRQEALARLVGVLLALILLGAMVEAFFAGWITRRLVALRDTAQSISKGQWNAKVDVNGGDEIADVAKAFQQMGAAIQQRMDALQAAQWRQQRLVAALSEGVLFHDATGTLLECNDAAPLLFGLSHAQMMRQAPRPELWKLSHPDGRLMQPNELPGMRALAERTLIQRQLLRLTLADGSERWLSANASPLSLPGQTDPYASVSSVIDVTEQVLALERIAHAQEELEGKVVERTRHLEDALAKLQSMQMELIEAQKLSALGSMVAGISHELNTPIGNAVTTASALQHLMNETRRSLNTQSVSRSALQTSLSQAEDMAALILKSTEKAAALIGSFKRVAVDDTSQLRRPFDLAQLTEDLLRTLQPSLKHCPWTIECGIKPSIVLDSFPGPLDQILTNLIQNAQVHAFPDGRSGTLHIEARQSGGQVALVVRDDGVGMPATVAQRAFEPFFTTRLGQGGSGLGLSIARTLVTKKLGGTIQLTSTPGVGTCFTLYLPLNAPESTSHPLISGFDVLTKEPL